MTRKTLWICEGCSTESLQDRQRPYDWKVVEMSVSGLDGYPTCGLGNMEGEQFDLCPACAERLSEAVRPRSWARPAKQEPAQ